MLKVDDIVDLSNGNLKDGLIQVINGFSDALILWPEGRTTLTDLSDLTLSSCNCAYAHFIRAGKASMLTPTHKPYCNVNAAQAPGNPTIRVAQAIPSISFDVDQAVIDEFKRNWDRAIGKRCECGTEKHGFASHSDWCEMSEHYRPELRVSK